MMGTTDPHLAPVRALAAAVQLLFRAAEQAWAQAEIEGPRSAGHLMGLRVHLAACQGLDLLGADGNVNMIEHPLHLGGGDVGELLRAAERAIRTVPVDAFQGTSLLVTVIGDLVRGTP